MDKILSPLAKTIFQLSSNFSLIQFKHYNFYFPLNQLSLFKHLCLSSVNHLQDHSCIFSSLNVTEHSIKRRLASLSYQSLNDSSFNVFRSMLTSVRAVTHKPTFVLEFVLFNPTLPYTCNLNGRILLFSANRNSKQNNSEDT